MGALRAQRRSASGLARKGGREGEEEDTKVRYIYTEKLKSQTIKTKITEIWQIDANRLYRPTPVKFSTSVVGPQSHIASASAKAPRQRSGSHRPLPHCARRLRCSGCRWCALGGAPGQRGTRPAAASGLGHPSTCPRPRRAAAQKGAGD